MRRIQSTDLCYLIEHYKKLGAKGMGELSAGSGMTAMTRDPEHAVRFFEEFSDRILYGCDICAETNTHLYKFDDFLTSLCESGAQRRKAARALIPFYGKSQIKNH